MARFRSEEVLLSLFAIISTFLTDTVVSQAPPPPTISNCGDYQYTVNSPGTCTITELVDMGCSSCKLINSEQRCIKCQGQNYAPTPDGKNCVYSQDANEWNTFRRTFQFTSSGGAPQDPIEECKLVGYCQQATCGMCQNEGYVTGKLDTWCENCNGANYLSTAGAPTNPNRKECLVNCNQAKTGFYSKTPTNDCLYCEGDCIRCIPNMNAPSQGTCTECKYNRQRFYPPAIFPNPSPPIPVPEGFPELLIHNAINRTASADKGGWECGDTSSPNPVLSRDTTLLDQTFHVRSDQIATDTGNDSPNSIFGVLTRLIDYHQIYQKQKIKVTIYLYQVVGQTTNNPFQISEHDLTDLQANFQNLWKSRAFDRTISEVIIMPRPRADCDTSGQFDDGTNLYRCLETGEKATIQIENRMFNFFVNNQLTIQNIIFKGNNLPPMMKSIIIGDPIPFPKYGKYKSCANNVNVDQCSDSSIDDPLNLCCQWDKFNYNPNYNILSEPPGPNDGQYNKLLGFETFENYGAGPKFLLMDAPNAMFEFQWIRDYASAPIPQLQLINVQFINFNPTYWKSLIAFYQAAHITITNCKFERMHFKYGLISNGLQLTYDRRSAKSRDATSSYIGYTCKDYGITYTDYCHKIEITNSEFRKFNDKKYTIDGGVEQPFQQGMVLSLQNIQGPIVLKNNIFQQLVTYVRTNGENNAYDCSRVSGLPGDKAGPTLTLQTSTQQQIFDVANDVVATSRYQIFLEKHARKFLTKKREISTAMHFQNITYGLTLYGNTFNQIYALTGAGMLIQGFTATADFPIIIERNTFSNNFVQFFGGSFAIFSQALDMTESVRQCQSVFVNDNTFQKNAGCNHAFGNIIISCEPNHPMVSQAWGSLESGYDTLDFNTYYTTYALFNDQSFQQPQDGSSPYYRFNRLRKDLVQEINQYELTPTQFSTQFGWTSSYTGNVPLNGLVFSNNQCNQNFFIISNCVFSIGFFNVLVEKNQFKNNGVPIWEWLNEHLYIGNMLSTNVFQVLNMGTGQVAKTQKKNIPSNDPDYNRATSFAQQTSPVIINLGNGVQIRHNTFDDNQNLFSGDFYLGGAVTVFRALGLQDVLIQDNNVYNYEKTSVDWRTTDPNSENPKYQYDYSSLPLFSVNFWENPGLQTQFQYTDSNFERGDVSRQVQRTDNTLVSFQRNKFENCTLGFFNDAKEDFVAYANDQNNFIGTGTGGVRLINREKYNYIKNLAVNTKRENYAWIFNLFDESDVYKFKEPITLSNQDNDDLFSTQERFYYRIEILIQDIYLKSVSSQNGLPFFDLTNGFQTNFENVTFDSTNIVEINSDPNESMLFFDHKYLPSNETLAFTAHIIIRESQTAYRDLTNSKAQIFSTVTDISFSNTNGPLLLVLGYGNSVMQGPTFDSTQINLPIDNVSAYYAKSKYSLISIINSKGVTLENWKLSSNSQLPGERCLIEQGYLFDLVSSSYLNLLDMEISQTESLNSLFGIKSSQQTTISSIVADQVFGSTNVILYSYGSKSVTLSSINIQNSTLNENIDVSRYQFQDLLAMKEPYPPSSFLISQSQVYVSSLTMVDSQAAITGFLIMRNSQVSIVSSQFSDIVALKGLTQIALLLGKSQLFFLQSSVQGIICDLCTGTVFYLQQSRFFLQNSIFNDSVGQTATVLYAQQAQVTIQKSNFTNNKATTMGGVMASYTGNTLIQESDFTNNFGDSLNFYFESSLSVLIEKSTFRNNTSVKQSKNILARDTLSFYIIESQFIDYNTQSGWNQIEASFLLIRGLDAFVLNSSFSGSMAKFGAIDAASSFNNTLTVVDSNFTDGVSDLSGAAIHSSECNLLVSNSSFVNNSITDFSSLMGSAINIEQSYVLFIGNSTFSLNQNYAIYARNTQNSFLIQNTTLQGNKTFLTSQQNSSNLQYGGLYSDSNIHLLILNSSFLNHYAKENGAAILNQYDPALQFVTPLNHTYILTSFIGNQAGKDGGAVYLWLKQNYIIFNLINSTISGNQANNGGGIYYHCYQENCTFNINSTLFSLNQATIEGGGLQFTQMIPNFIDPASNNSFLSNKALYGNDVASYPIIFREQQNITLADYQTQITTKSSASSSSSSSTNQTKLTQSQLTSSAQDSSETAASTTASTNEDGILRLRRLMSEFLEEINFSKEEEKISSINNNKNQRKRFLQGDIQLNSQDSSSSSSATTSSGIKADSLSEKESSVKTQLISGQPALPPPIFQLYDMYGQVVLSLNDTTMSVQTQDLSLKILSQKQFASEMGTYVLYPLTVVFQPGKKASLQFSSDAINTNPQIKLPNQFIPQTTVQLQTSLRNCSVNEKWTDDDQCSVCPQGTMNVFPEKKSFDCENCPDQSSLCEGGGLVGPEVGFWRHSNRSRNFLECLNAAACIGAWQSSSNLLSECKDGFYFTEPNYCPNGWCSQQYTGNLCSNCAKGYAKSSQIYCVPCQDNPMYYVIMVLVIIGAIIFVTYTIYNVVNPKKKKSKVPIEPDGKQKDDSHRSQPKVLELGKNQDDSPPAGNNQLYSILPPQSIDRTPRNQLNLVQSEQYKKNEINGINAGNNVNFMLSSVEPIGQQHPPSLHNSIHSDQGLANDNNTNLNDLLQARQQSLNDDSPTFRKNIKQVDSQLENSQKENNQKNKLDKQNNQQQESDQAENNRSSVLLKIIMNYFQMVAIIATFDFQYSDDVKDSLQTQQKISQSTSEVLSFDCFLQGNTGGILGAGDITIFFLKLLFISLAPLLFGIVVLLVWTLIYLVKHGKLWLNFKEKLQSNILASLIVILFTIHTMMVTMALKSLRCQNIGDIDNPYTYMDEDYDIVCWEGIHLQYVLVVSIPSIGLWGIIAPLFGWRHLALNQDKLENDQFQISFGFLYDGYKLQTYFWEFITLYRQMLLVFASVFMASYSVHVQAICVVGISFYAFMLQVQYEPFMDDDINFVEQSSLISATITLYFGLYWLSGKLGDRAGFILFVLIMVTNISFGLFWIQSYLQELIEKLMKKKGKQGPKVIPIPQKDDEIDNQSLGSPSYQPAKLEPYKAIKPESPGLQINPSNQNQNNKEYPQVDQVEVIQLNN